MKVLTNKQVDEVLKRVAVCQIITNKYMNINEAFLKMSENLCDVAFKVGGEKKALKVLNTIKKYCEK